MRTVARWQAGGLAPDGGELRSGVGRRRRRSRWLLATLVVVASLGYVVWVVVVDSTEIDQAVLRFQAAELRWLIAAILLEACSQLAASLMQRRMVEAAGTELPVRHAVGLILAQNAIALSVPGGPVLASAYGFRQLRSRGTDAAAASWVVAATNVVSGLAIGLFVLVAVGGTNAVSVLTIGGFVLCLVVLVVAVEQPDRLRAPARLAVRAARRVRRRPTDGVDAQVDSIVARLSTVRLRRIDWAILGVFAVASIATDCAALFCCVHAVTRLPTQCLNPNLTARQAQRCRRLRPPASGAVLVAYAAGQGAMALPFIPGGVGLVESAMTAALTAGGLGLIPALSVVLLYRFLSFWGVLVLGGGCWLALRRGRPATADDGSPRDGR
jgi:uncharacterized membrane protein YbhN (UPF0104 family)